MNYCWKTFCLILNEFWDKLKILNSYEKLKLTKYYSSIKWINNRRYRKKDTRGFHKYKHCQICNSTGIIYHHIIQLQNGGYDSGNNRMRVCYKCHSLIHPWLNKK